MAVFTGMIVTTGWLGGDQNVWKNRDFSWYSIELSKNAGFHQWWVLLTGYQVIWWIGFNRFFFMESPNQPTWWGFLLGFELKLGVDIYDLTMSEASRDWVGQTVCGNSTMIWDMYTYIYIIQPTILRVSPTRVTTRRLISRCSGMSNYCLLEDDLRKFQLGYPMLSHRCYVYPLNIVIAMENASCTDDLPMRHGDFHSYVSIQAVI
jgi:hypothetical protein